MRIDSHMHYHLMTNYKDILEALDQTGCERGGLVAQINHKRSTETIDVLHAKYCSNGRLYAFGALAPIYYIKHEEMAEGMVEHVKDIMACGCDGIKMIEGKPSSRKNWDIPNFDDPLYEPYWAYVEEQRIPIIWHVNDPEEFWSDELCPHWAKRSGWFYGEGDWVNNEDQYTQIANVLKRHPNLQITFAHFYFLSAQLERLSKIFDACPNVCVDIVPGIELFTNLSANLDEAKKFFTKYQDRIIYGTDISRRPKDKDHEFSMKDSYIRGKLCNDFILTDHVFIPGDEKSLLGKDDLDINGLELGDEIGNKIFCDNFYRIVGEPKKVNIDKCLEFIKKERSRITYIANYYGEEPDYLIVNYCEGFFEKEKKSNN